MGYVYDGTDIIVDVKAAGNVYTLPGVVSEDTSLATPDLFYNTNALGSTLYIDNNLTGTGPVSRSEYDAFGQTYTIQAGTTTRYQFAGKHGYQTDSFTGLTMCGARFYLPTLGRFLTQDPSGQKAGLNLYEYCKNNPLAKVDPTGLDYHDRGFWGNSWFAIKGWANAFHAAGGFALGVGPTENIFEPGTLQSEQMEESVMGGYIETAVRTAGFPRHMAGFSSFAGSPKEGHTLPFWASIAEPANGTQFQVGGFIWTADRAGNREMIHVHNEISLRSLIYQIRFVPNWDRFGSGFGPFGTVSQDFYWYIPAQRGR